jgi:nucleotide-binding universal stress UspA family protein
MFKGIKTILFTTNLSKNCVPAFDVAVMLAMQFKAKILLLHVMESIPDYVEGRLEGLLGENQWKDMQHSHENEVRQKLIGKRSSNTLIQKALEHFCTEAGIDEASCGYQAREVIIDDGDVPQSILANAKAHECDIIIMGAPETRLLKKSIGNTTKSVLKKSKVPVIVVPVDPKEKKDLPDLSSWSS